MENGDLEVNNLEVDRDLAQFTITAAARGTRCCADCGTELKSLDFDFDEKQVELEDLDGWDDLTDTQREAIKDAIDEATGEVTEEIDEEGTDVSEGGGGRYAKNIITSTLDWKLTMSFTPDAKNEKRKGAGTEVKLTASGQLTNRVAASEYEECC